MARGSLTIIRDPATFYNSLPRPAAPAPQVAPAPKPLATTTDTAVSELDKLITQLAAGGTAQQQQLTAERNAEITRNRAQQAGYTKDAAFSDAQSLVNKAIADALRQASPQITAAAEGAGASKSTFRANLTQEAATRGALEGAAQGAQLATAYGTQYNQLAAVLENLTRQDPNSPTALLAQTIVGSKGIIKPPEPEQPFTTVSTATTGTANQNYAPAPVQQQQAAPLQTQVPSLSLNPFIDSWENYLTPEYFLNQAKPTNTVSGGSGGIIVSNPAEYETNVIDNFWDF